MVWVAYVPEAAVDEDRKALGGELKLGALTRQAW